MAHARDVGERQPVARRRLARRQAEAARDLGHERFVLEPAHRDHDDLAGAEPALELTHERRAREGRHRVHRAEDGPAERVVAPELRRELVGHHGLGAVLVGQDLLAHDRALALDLRLVEARAAHDVGHHLDRLRQVFGEHAGGVADLLARRERVEVTAERLEARGDRARVARGRALEHHVLDEVRDPELLARLVARAGAKPRAERQRAPVGQRLGQHGEPVREHGLVDGCTHLGILREGRVEVRRAWDGRTARAGRPEGAGPRKLPRGPRAGKRRAAREDRPPLEITGDYRRRGPRSRSRSRPPRSRSRPPPPPLPAPAPT